MIREGFEGGGIEIELLDCVDLALDWLLSRLDSIYFSLANNNEPNRATANPNKLSGVTTYPNAKIPRMVCRMFFIWPVIAVASGEVS